MSIDPQIAEQKTTARKKAGFDKWRDEPMVRMGISMIPAGDRQDALLMLLQSAFDAGFSNGSSDILGHLIEGILSRRPEDKR